MKTDHDWHGLVTEQTRDAILAGKVPSLVFDLEPPAMKPGDHIVLEVGESQDPEARSRFKYPKRWIVVIKVSRKDAGTSPRWIVDYCPPERGTVFLRRGGGTTVDRFQSIDREVEAERDVYVPSLKRGTNTLIREQRRIEGELAGHMKRLANTQNKTTKRLLPAMIASCRDKLAELEDHEGQETAA